MAARSRRRALVPVLAVAAALLVSCGSQQAPGPGASSTTTIEAPAFRGAPSDLIGVWAADGPDVPDGVLLTIAADEIRIWWGDCGATMLPWRASPSGMFASSVSGWSGRCGDDAGRAPWLTGATAWRAIDGGAELLKGVDVVVQLAPTTSTPTPGPDVAQSMATPEPLTDEQRTMFDSVPALPAGARPVTAADLVGTWVVPGRTASGSVDTPHARFSKDGTWKGSDGCNSNGGQWRADGSGSLIATAGVQTLIGCDGAAVPSWVSSAAAAGIEDGTLVLVGWDGKVVGRLQRA